MNKKILIIMEGYFPGKKYGGPPVSVNNFCTLLNEDCYIVTRNHDLNEKEEYTISTTKWIDRENCKVMYLKDKEYCRKYFEKILIEINPDIIYLQGLFQKCIFPCLFIARKYNKKVLLAPRGELCQGAFKKKYKKIPYIFFLKASKLLKSVYFQSTSDEETVAISKYLKVPYSRIFQLDNIPSIPAQNYERSIKKTGEASFVFLSRIHSKKNLLSAIKFLTDVKGEINFDIYGPIEDENYWNECQKEIKKLPKNVKVIYRGLITHEDVHRIFSSYDAFLFPTLSENYGHVIAESLSVGTPVIISDQTPWNDVEEYGVGWSISLAQPNKFKKAINEIIKNDREEQEKMSTNCKVFFEKKLCIDEILKEYQRVIMKIGEDNENK